LCRDLDDRTVRAAEKVANDAGTESGLAAQGQMVDACPLIFVRP
jgi:hypothetical protein